MAKLSEEAKELIGEIRPALVATASKDGKPNVSAKGSLRVIGDDTVAFADVASPRTVANIRENPYVSIICLDAVNRKACRIWGAAEVLDGGDLFQEIASQFAARSIQVRNVVSVRVNEIQTT